MPCSKIKKAAEIESQNQKVWINSNPYKLENLRGKIVLLDFWTYSCVNCIRTLPALKEIWGKYKNKRFMLIGIHTPEFEFEKEIGNVKYAVKKYKLEYPILSDPKRVNWENYGNTYWPRAALINSEGNIILEHVGEAGYSEIDKIISEELVKLKEITENSEIIEEPPKKPAAFNMSHETYAGSARNEGLGSSKVCSKKGCDEYYDSKDYMPGIISPHGDWNQNSEFLEYKGDENNERWIAYKYYASEVNVVISGYGEAEVLLNDKPISKEDAEESIIIKNGRSYVKIEGPDMHNLIKTEDFHSNILKIIPFFEMKVYAYTFG